MTKPYFISLSQRSRALQDALVALAFWTLAAIAVFNLTKLHLWGIPRVQFAVVIVTAVCCLTVVSLVTVQYARLQREPVWSLSFWRHVVGTPGLLLFAAMASYVAIGTVIPVVEGKWHVDAAGHLRYRLLYFGILVAATLGGRAILEQTGVDRLLRRILIILIVTCAVVPASPILFELGILAPNRNPFRLPGVFTSPNNAGALVACMTVALAVAFLNDGGARKLGYLGMASGTLAVLATGSRTSLLVLAAVLLMFTLLNPRNKSQVAFLLLWTCGAIGVVVLAAQFVPLGQLQRYLPEGWNAVNESFLCEERKSDHSGADSDCLALLSIKQVLAGDATLNWDLSVPVERWTGVALDHMTRHVVALRLRYRELSGSIPPELGQLRELVILDLAHNRLGGVIPSELKTLEDLRILNLTGNMLTGSIPPALAALARLEHLRLGGNQLTDHVPSEFGDLSRLTIVNLGINRLTGVLPPEFGRLTKLRELRLNDNNFTGRIPAQFGGLSNLRILRLDGNLVDGPVPSGLEAIGIDSRHVFDNYVADTAAPDDETVLGRVAEVFENRRFMLWRLGFRKGDGGASVRSRIWGTFLFGQGAYRREIFAVESPIICMSSCWERPASCRCRFLFFPLSWHCARS